MPAQRLAMRQVHAVLRLKWEQGLSDRKIAHSLGHESAYGRGVCPSGAGGGCSVALARHL
jgi:hypothetical protein